MKKLLSLAMLCTFLAANPMNVAFAQEVAQTTKKPIELIFNEFKTALFINGVELEKATEVLVDKLVDQKITTGELQFYVAKHSSQNDYKKFNEMLSLSLEDIDTLDELGEDDLSFILQNTLETTNSTGSNFMSCSMGTGVGIPLIAVGLILGISALTNSSASKAVVTKDYLAKKQTLATDYLNTIADLELEVTTYQSDIIYYQDEINELNRRIDTGLYSVSEIEDMHQLIRDYTYFVTDAQALIGEVGIDLTYFHNQFSVDSDIMSQDEVAALSEVDDRHAKAGKQAIAAGVIGGVGTVFAALGAGDCN
jgi:hypothetical protein